MVKNTFLVEIKGKRVKDFLTRIFRLKINIYDIKYYRNRVVIEVDYLGYESIKKIKTSYEINVISVKGKRLFFSLLKKYKIYFSFVILGFVLLIFLSKMVFFIRIDSSSKEVVNLINSELKKNGLTIYSFKKSFKELRDISLKIKENNKDVIEWIEIKSNGVFYNISVIPRVKDSKDNYVSSPKDIVALKNGMIVDMDVDAGSIIKNKGDYVSKGEVIVSGYIERNGEVVGSVSSYGKVYAEVWYKVNLGKKFKYLDKVLENRSEIKYKVNILGKDFVIFKYKSKKLINKSKTIDLGFFQISKEQEIVSKEVSKKYSKKDLQIILEDLAKEAIEKRLDDEEYIISQKTLKIKTTSDKMDIEVFFKVYEDIAKIVDAKMPEVEDEVR